MYVYIYIENTYIYSIESCNKCMKFGDVFNVLTHCWMVLMLLWKSKITLLLIESAHLILAL